MVIINRLQKVEIRKILSYYGRITSIMDNYVKKSGDTMTGKLIIQNEKFMTIGTTARILESHNANNVTMGTFEVYQDNDTLCRTALFAFNPSDNSKCGILQVVADGDNFYAVCPNSNHIGSIVNTSVIDNNKCLFSNGLAIQWGSTPIPGNGSATITFPYAFVDTNYSICGDMDHFSDAYQSRLAFFDRTTTKCQADWSLANYVDSIRWIAIGRWY